MTRIFHLKVKAFLVDVRLILWLLFSVQYHPDVNKEPGATEKFKEISAAYEVCMESTLLTVMLILLYRTGNYACSTSPSKAIK